MLTMRARQPPGPRGIAANLKTLRTVHGEEILRWLTLLSREIVLQLQEPHLLHDSLAVSFGEWRERQQPTR